METLQEENIVEEVWEAEIWEVPTEEVEKYLEEEKNNKNKWENLDNSEENE